MYFLLTVEIKRQKILIKTNSTFLFPQKALSAENPIESEGNFLIGCQSASVIIGVIADSILDVVYLRGVGQDL